MVWLGVLLALGTSVSWALGNVLTQRLGQRLGPARGMVWALAAGGALAAPFAALLDTRPEPVGAAIVAWAAAAAIAGVVAYAGLFYAFANEELSVAVPIVSSWPVVSLAVSLGLLGETLDRAKLPGTAAVLAGVVLVAIPKPRDAAAPPRKGSRAAVGAAFASAVGFGVMIPAMGRIAPALGAFGASVVVYALGLAVAGVAGRLAGLDLSRPPRASLALVLATGAVETAGFVCVALARRFAPMTLVAPVASLAATITLFYAWGVIGERPRAVAALGALAASIGVALLAS